MRDRATRGLILSIAGALMILFPAGAARGQEKPATPPRKVLVELYTSQGCDSCPPASDLLAKLAALGYGPDRVVPINFHVDYFNTPWEDPFSDPSFSEREQSYNQVMKRTDLYFTPMMMVDGKYPLLGSNRALAESSIRQARKQPPGVTLDLALLGSGLQKTLAVKLVARGAEVAGSDLLIGVALTQDRVSTRVPSGENAGKTLVETNVVRRLDHKFTKLDRAEPKTLSFPIGLPAGSEPGGFHVAVFVQDRNNGQVHQADSVPWLPTPPTPKTATR